MNDDELQDPVAQSVLATEPTATVPNWTIRPDDKPDDAVARMKDLARTHAIAGRSYEDMASNFGRHFDGFDPPSKEEYAQWESRAPREARLELARSAVAKEQGQGTLPGEQNYALRKFTGLLRDPAMSMAYGHAKHNIETDQADDSDYRAVAMYEHEQQSDAARPLWQRLGGVALGAPGQVAALASGPIGAGAAIGIPALVHSNIEAGNDVLSLAGAPKAAALTAAQLGTLKLAGMVGQKVFPTLSQSTAGQVGTQALMGPFAQQGADATAYLLGLQTHYGSVESLLKGNGGEYLQHTFNDMLTFGGLGFAHGVKTFNERVGRGEPVKVAAEAARQKAADAAKEFSPKSENPPEPEVRPTVQTPVQTEAPQTTPTEAPQTPQDATGAAPAPEVAAKPTEAATLTLGPGKAGSTMDGFTKHRHKYFTADGKEAGEITIVPREGGKELYIAEMGGEGVKVRDPKARNTVGIRALMGLKDQLLQAYPKAERATFLRPDDPSGRTRPDRRGSVRLREPGEEAPAPTGEALPADLLDSLKQYGIAENQARTSTAENTEKSVITGQKPLESGPGESASSSTPPLPDMNPAEARSFLSRMGHPVRKDASDAAVSAQAEKVWAAMHTAKPGQVKRPNPADLAKGPPEGPIQPKPPGAEKSAPAPNPWEHPALTGRERHLVREAMAGRSPEEIAGDAETRSKEGSKARPAEIKTSLTRAWAKIASEDRNSNPVPADLAHLLDTPGLTETERLVLDQRLRGSSMLDVGRLSELAGKAQGSIEHIEKKALAKAKETRSVDEMLAKSRQASVEQLNEESVGETGTSEAKVESAAKAQQEGMAEAADAKPKIELTAADKMRRIKPVGKEFESLASEAGIDPDELHAYAGYIHGRNAEISGENAEFSIDALRKAARKKARSDPKRYRTLDKIKGAGDRGEDPASYKGFDEIAEDLASLPEFKAIFGNAENETGGTGERLWDILVNEQPAESSERKAYQEALNHLVDREVQSVRAALAKAGADPKAVDAAFGPRPGEAEAGADAETGHTGDVGGFDPAELESGHAPQAAAAPQVPGRNGADHPAGPAAESAFGQPLSDAERNFGPSDPTAVGGIPGIPFTEARRTTNAPEPQLTALANAKVDKERASRGLPELMAAARRTNPEVWDRAMAQLDADPKLAERLVEELTNKTRSTTVDENAILLQHRVALSNELTRAMTGSLTGDSIDAMSRFRRAGEVLDQIDQLDKVVRSTGTEWGRAGQFRKQLAAEDYSLAGMLQTLKAAKGPKEVTPEEMAKVKELSEKIADLQKKLDAAEERFVASEKPKGAAVVETPAYKDMEKARVAADATTGEFKRLVGKARKENRGWGEYVSDLLIKLRVNEVISSPVTLGKIVAASAERVAIAPLEQAVGSFWSKVPGLAKIAAKAPREGKGFTPATEYKSILSIYTKGMQDVFRTLRTGKSELDVVHGKSDVPRDWLDLQFSLHDAMKAPAVRAEYTRSFLNRIDAAAKAGQDATSPAALLRFSMEAYKDGQRAKFRGDNRLVDKINQFLKAGPDAGFVERAATTAGKLLLPVVRIPTNLAFETATYAFGTGTGSVRAVRAWVRGMENLQPAEADAIMRSLKKGSLGLAALALGYANPQIFGGYYAPKRDEKDVKAGGMRLGGVEVPSWLMHNPLLEVLQFGATVRRAADKTVKGDKQGLIEGALSGGAGLAEEIPLVRETGQVAGLASHNARERGHYLGELAKSFAVPQFVQWLAGQMDKPHQFSPSEEPRKRKPEGVWQNVETGIPRLREKVPLRK